MDKSRGFTLIEFIFTLVLTAIMAGVIIEIIAGPIKSYFWATQRAKVVESAELSFALLERELSISLVPSLQMDNQQIKQSLIFKKIIDSGFVVQEAKEASLLSVISRQAKEIKENQSYLIYFPQKDEYKDKIFNGKIKREQGKTTLQLEEKVGLTENSPQLFYILSSPIEYHCDPKTQSLTRTQDKEIALVANQVKGCHFALNQDAKAPTLLISLEMDAQQKEPISMIYPMMLKVGYEI